MNFLPVSFNTCSSFLWLTVSWYWSSTRWASPRSTEDLSLVSSARSLHSWYHPQLVLMRRYAGIFGEATTCKVLLLFTSWLWLEVSSSFFFSRRWTFHLSFSSPSSLSFPSGSCRLLLVSFPPLICSSFVFSACFCFRCMTVTISFSLLEKHYAVITQNYEVQKKKILTSSLKHFLQTRKKYFLGQQYWYSANYKVKGKSGSFKHIHIKYTTKLYSC